MISFFKGCLYLFGSVAWMLLLVPGSAIYGAMHIYAFYVVFPYQGQMDKIELALRVLISLGTVASFVLITYVGVGFVKSSVRLIKYSRLNNKLSAVG